MEDRENEGTTAVVGDSVREPGEVQLTSSTVDETETAIKESDNDDFSEALLVGDSVVEPVEVHVARSSVVGMETAAEDSDRSGLDETTLLADSLGEPLAKSSVNEMEESDRSGPEKTTPAGDLMAEPVQVRVVKSSVDDAETAAKGGDDSELEDHVFEAMGRLGSHSLSPLVSAESFEDFDLPPQLMMCRRNSVTFIAMPKALHYHKQQHLERSDTAPAAAADSRRHHQRAPLLRGQAIGGPEGSPEDDLEEDPFAESFARRTSTSQLPFPSYLSVDLGVSDRLSRSQDDLLAKQSRRLQRQGSSPLGTAQRRRTLGVGLLQQMFSSRSQTTDEESLDEDMASSSRLLRQRRRRSSASLIHRQSSGATLCVPLQHSLNVSPVETEEEDEEEDDDEDGDTVDEPHFEGFSGRRLSTTTAIFRQASTGATLCVPVRPSIDLDGESDIDEGHQDVPDSPIVGRSFDGEDELDAVTLSYHDESGSVSSQSAAALSGDQEAGADADLPPGMPPKLQKKGSIAIPLERSTLHKKSRDGIRRFLASICSTTRLRFSESYFAVKGAALILPQSECPRTITRGTHGGDIQSHLQSMFYLLRPPDTIKVAVKLESLSSSRNRYMAVVSTIGRQDTEESIILGIDIEADKSTIGLVLPIWGDTSITLDGDGGFKVTSNDRHHIFKPVSVQAMWSALQSLIKARDTAHASSYYPGGLTHTWVSYYEVHVTSDQPAINEWNTMEDIESHRPPDLTEQESLEKVELEKLIRVKLKEIMLTVDLEEVTSKYLRGRLEEEMGMGLKDLRHFIDEEMIVILRQMDSASEILPFLYLGSEWNASNLEELQVNGVNHILNVTREIDNFFPGIFDYHNIRVYDTESAELLKHWDNTYKFITKARTVNSKVLVHCKMGVSRSASTVIAFAMKEYGWSLQEAYEYVKKKRSCIRPNKGFWQQLITYEGILDASKQRNSKLWRSKSAGNLVEATQMEAAEEEKRLSSEMPEFLSYPSEGSARPRSWSPEDSTAEILMKTQDLGSDGDSSDDEMRTNYSELHPDQTISPFFNWDDDVDDTSSHSVDSLLANTQDEVVSKTSDSFDRRPQPQVVLLSYRAFSGSDGGDGGGGNTSDGNEALTEESDLEDFVAEESSGRAERGFYDVQMLMTNFLGPEVEGQEDDEVPVNHINYFLHPDIKMELLMAQQRKHRRIAQLLRLSQQQPADDQRTGAAGSAAGAAPTSTKPNIPTAAPQVAKLRADNSWIKEIPPSPQAAGEDRSLTTEALLSAEAPPSFELPEAAADASCSVDLEVAAAVAATPPEAGTDDGGGGCDRGASPEVDSQSNGEDPARSITTDSDSASQDVGVVQHYHKEDIPWNLGTVKRHKHDLERRLKTRKSAGDGGSSSSRVSSASCSSDTGSSESLENVHLMDSSPVIPDPAARGSCGPQTITISGAEVGESSTDDLLPQEGSSVFQSTGQEGPSGGGGAGAAGGVGDSPEGVLLRPSSIYEKEDITVEPGVVQRTKQEIEKRGSITSPDLDTDLKPVQRSSSLKEGHSRKDRSSERRRTCTPVLRTSASSESDVTDSESAADRSSSKQSTSPEEPQEGAEVKVVQIGSETVEVVEGQVKKHKRAIESRNCKSECETVEEVPVDAADDTPCKPPSQSPPLDSSSGASCSSNSSTALNTGVTLQASVGTSGKESSPSEEAQTCNRAALEKAASSLTPGQSIKPPVTASKTTLTVRTASVTTSEGGGASSDSVPTEQEDTDSSKESDKPSRVLSVSGEESLSISAYPTEDIPWSVGTVRQQTEAIEKVNSSSRDRSTRSSSKSPTNETLAAGSCDTDRLEGVVLHRTSSCKTPTSSQEANTGSFNRSSSVKDSSNNKSELKISLSTPSYPAVLVSQKEIKMASNMSPSLEAELKKMSRDKEVLILEAPKSVAVSEEMREKKVDTDSSTKGTSPPAGEPAVGPTDKSEEKKFWDIVDMFEPKESASDQSTKQKDKKQGSPTEEAGNGRSSKSKALDLTGEDVEPKPIHRSRSVTDRPTYDPPEKCKLDRKVSLPTYKKTAGVATVSKEGSDSGKAASSFKTKTLDARDKPTGSTLPGALASGSESGSACQRAQPEVEPELDQPKTRKYHGKSHPLTILSGKQGQGKGGFVGGGGKEKTGQTAAPVYNTT